jgi:hypothetical protein
MAQGGQQRRLLQMAAKQQQGSESELAWTSVPGGDALAASAAAYLFQLSQHSGGDGECALRLFSIFDVATSGSRPSRLPAAELHGEGSRHHSDHGISAAPGSQQ